MARPDKHEKQRQRAREAVDTALQRGRLAEAADALLALPAEERSFALSRIAIALSTEAGRRTLASDLPTALAWLLRNEREPRMLPGGDDGARARWALFLAALRARQWSRAQALLDALRPALDASALLAQLAALVAAEGRPDPDLFAAERDPDSERLGYDETRRSYTCPSTVEQVEAACIGCLGCERWPRFRDVIMGWLKLATPAVAQEIRRLGVLLSQRELVIRARDPRAALEVARFCAVLAAELVEVRAGPRERSDNDATAELEPVFTACVRSVARALAAVEARGSARECAKVHDAQVVEAAATVASVAVRYPPLAEAMEAITIDSRFEAPALDAAERLLRVQLERAPTPRLLLRAFELCAAQREDRSSARDRDHEAPSWLLGAFEQALEQPATLAAALAGLVRDRSVGGLGVFDLVPIRLATTAIERLWAHGDDPQHEFLARAAEELYARMKAASEPPNSKRSEARAMRMLRVMAGGFADDLSDAQLRKYFDTPQGRSLRQHLTDVDTFDAPLSPVMEKLWSTIEERVVPFRLSLLEATLERSPKPAERRTLARCFWARRPTLLTRIETLRQANGDGLILAEKLLQAELMTALVPEPLDAARALLYAHAVGAPRDLLAAVARALLEAAERTPVTGEAPELAQALRLAAKLTRKRAPQKRRTPKRQSTKEGARAATERPASKRGKKSRVQLEFEPISEGRAP